MNRETWTDDELAELALAILGNPDGLWVNHTALHQELMAVGKGQERNLDILRQRLQRPKPPTYKTIGESYGISPERVRQINAKMIRLLRHPVRSRRYRGKPPVNSLDDLGQEIGSAQIAKAIFKHTDCGAWFEETETGIAMGSIVEGTDQSTETRTLDYPFAAFEFWAALDEIEMEARGIWNDTHGCYNCWDGHWKDKAEHWPIDPDCPSCQGEGVVI